MCCRPFNMSEKGRGLLGCCIDLFPHNLIELSKA